MTTPIAPATVGAAAAANVGTSTGKRTTLLRRIWIVLFALCYLPYFASAQGTGTTSNSNNNGPSGTGSVNSTTFTSTALPPDMTTTLINITTSNWIPLPVVTQLTTSRTRIFTITTTTSIPLPTTITTISTISIATTTTTTTTNSTSTSSPSPTSRTPPPNVLTTRLTAPFALLGIILILTGLPSVFYGHKNRWSSYFLLGFYAFSLGTCALVLRYGVIPHLRDDTDLPGNKEQGLYLLAAFVAGVLGGGIGIFFWGMSRYLIGGWGGLVVGFYVQCFRDGGLIRSIGFRWLMFIACSAGGFVLCTIPRLHYHVLLGSTAIVGATALMLGIDCFTTAGLKEFYIYNLGFHELFPKFASLHSGFPVSQTMQIELGLISAVALMGAAIQFRVLTMLQYKLRQISEEHRRKDEELERKAAGKFKTGGRISVEREEWEKRHGRGDSSGSGGSGGSGGDLEKGLGGGVGRRTSIAGVPLLNQDGGTSSPGTPSYTDRPLSLSSVLNFGGGGGGGPIPLDSALVEKPSQAPGILPPMDLGTQVKSQLPEELISKTSTIDEHPEIKKRIQLIEEIRELRRSIGSLGRSTTDMGGGAITGYGEIDRDRQAALERAGSGYGIGSSGGYYNGNDRTRVKSMIAMPTGRPLSTPLPYQLHSYQQYGPQQQQQQQQQSSSSHSGTMTPPATIRRPGSAPLTRGEEWETYVSERKLFTPPAGVTAPIQPSPLPEGLKANTRIVPSEAVSAAVEERKRRESLFGLGSDKDASGRNSSSSGGGGGGGGGSGLGLKLGGENGTGRRSSLLGLDFMLSSRTGEGGQPESPSSPPPPRISTGDSPVTPPVAGPSSPSRGTHSHRRSRSLGNVFSRLTLNKNDPPVVLPPQRSASPPPTPQPRVVTYEELQERHKAKMKRMQEPISRAATEEATLAEARSRWERSKAIEKEVMERKLAEAQAKLKDRGGVGTRVGSHRRSLSQTQVPERNPLSLERLKSAAGGGGLGRMSASSKVEEWRKYRTTTTTTTTTTPPAGAGARTSAEVDEDQPLAQLQSQQKDVGGAGIGVGVGVGGARRRSVSGNRMSLSGGLEYERRRSTSGGLLGGVAAAAAAAAAPTGVPPSSPK